MVAVTGDAVISSQNNMNQEIQSKGHLSTTANYPFSPHLIIHAWGRDGPMVVGFEFGEHRPQPIDDSVIRLSPSPASA
jgi:predicted LPLAT superfamily acyltransferase